MTAQPQTEITRILEWVGEPFSEATLDTTQETTTISDAEESWKGNVRKPIQSDRAEAWRRELPTDQVLVAEAVMGRMQTAPYPRIALRGCSPEPRVANRERCVRAGPEPGFLAACACQRTKIA